MLRIVNPNSQLGPSGFVFTRESGVLVSKFDPGFPEIRNLSDNIPQAHGAQDYTTYFGPRAITLEFRIYPGWASSDISRRDIIDTLNALSNPQLRPFLYESIDGRIERRIMIRPDGMSLPYEMPHTNAVQMQWIAPLGLWESGELVVNTVGPGTEGDLNVGRSYNRTFPQIYASRAPAGGRVIINEGSVETYPAMIVYGPFTSLAVSNETTQKTLSFPALSLIAGESLVIDMKSRSITMGGQPNISKYDAVDWTISSWFSLNPGENMISFTPTGIAEGTKLDVAHRHNWI